MTVQLASIIAEKIMQKSGENGKSGLAHYFRLNIFICTFRFQSKWDGPQVLTTLLTALPVQGITKQVYISRVKAKHCL